MGQSTVSWGSPKEKVAVSLEWVLAISLLLINLFISVATDYFGGKMRSACEGTEAVYKSLNSNLNKCPR